MNRSWRVVAAAIAVTGGFAGCKSDGAATSTTPRGSVSISATGVVAPAHAAASTADKTAEFLSAFRPKDQQ
ncbi:hypothetical protein [Variovorax sp. KK3]|uniref:hypothetical protein n=1 Tax=Variovorax sp. KK3 TaxID=1855728 RepID=UPI00117FF9D6|nr:hypothetical protein [Variovorax sp. KK3]